MATVTTPLPGFNGSAVGVVFTDGVGRTTDPQALAYFARHGYGIARDEPAAAPPPAPEPHAPQAKRAPRKAAQA